MTTDAPDDLPSKLTRLLREVPGVHTVYATRAPIPTIVTAVVEMVKNKPVGVHLVTIHESDDRIEVTACIGVSMDESAIDIVRRAHDAIDDYLTNEHDERDRTVSVTVGRVS
jgi:hypothetical protein